MFIMFKMIRGRVMSETENQKSGATPADLRKALSAFRWAVRRKVWRIKTRRFLRSFRNFFKLRRRK